MIEKPNIVLNGQKLDCVASTRKICNCSAQNRVGFAVSIARIIDKKHAFYHPISSIALQKMVKFPHVLFVGNFRETDTFLKVSQ